MHAIRPLMLVRPPVKTGSEPQFWGANRQFLLAFRPPTVHLGYPLFYMRSAVFLILQQNVSQA